MVFLSWRDKKYLESLIFSIPCPWNCGLMVSTIYWLDVDVADFIGFYWFSCLLKNMHFSNIVVMKCICLKPVFATLLVSIKT